MKISNWNIEEQTGYTPITTSYTDLSIADHDGVEAVRDTIKRLFNTFKSFKKEGYKYITELTMALNWKIWEHYQTNKKLAEVYNEEWNKLQDWCYDNFNKDQLNYYFKITD